MIKKERYHVWRAYVKFLQKKFPDKGLKWILQTFHSKNPASYEHFKKTRYL
jgi:hypothetical protein